MIQINLLPDVKLEFLHSQRTKRNVFSSAIVASLVLVGITLLLALHVYVNQSLHTKRLQSDIGKLVTELEAIEDLDTILTIRQQLLALPTLHSTKPAGTRLQGFLGKLVPNDIDLSEVAINFNDLTLRLSGNGTNSKVVNKFADILKNAYLSYGDGSAPSLAFSGVEFDIGITSENSVNFDAQMKFNAELFNQANKTVSITIPNIVSTQSSIRSGALFDLPKAVD